MPNLIAKTWRRAVNYSPSANFQWLKKKLRPAPPVALPPSVKPAPVAAVAPAPTAQTPEQNHLLSNFYNRPFFQRFIAYTLQNAPAHVVLLGTPQETEFFAPTLQARGKQVTCAEAETDIPPAEALGDYLLFVCSIPTAPSHWERMQRLKRKYPSCIGIEELAFPFTTIGFAIDKFHGGKSKQLQDLAPYYLGEKYFGPLQELDALFPLRNRSVIEFGPLDGAQTAGLAHLGAKQVTAIEARPENFVKTKLMALAFGFENVKVILDDFHNADATRYGRFDLAFAHGVYYHSIAPFIFFENLISLSDTIFLGGFCASDDLPNRPYKTLEHQGRTYRVKDYVEGNYFTAGVNTVGYYFDGEDLMRFFQERGYHIQVLDDKVSDNWAGRYLRFLASKQNGI